MRRTWAVRDLFISSSYLPGPLGLFFCVWSCLCEESIVITSDYNRLTFLKKGGGMREGLSKKKLVVLFML